MVEKWKQFEADSDLYPNLKYVTVGDARVRDKHKAWDGLVLPISHAFWKTHLTPNDWGCRCNIQQTDEPISSYISDIKLKSEFENNAALSGKIFNKIAYDNNEESISNLSKFLENEKNLLETSNPLVKISLAADKNDLQRNFEIADICSKSTNLEFLIRSHVELPNLTNPEYLISNKYLADRKSVLGINNMRGVIDNSKKQMYNSIVNPDQIPYYIVWDFDSIENLNINEIIRTLQRKINNDRGKSIKGMIFQYKGKVAHLTREQIINRDFKELDNLK